MDWPLHPSLLAALRAALQQSPRYAALATTLQGLILQGELLPGDRLPAERRLADQLGLSRSTVVAAYARLAEGGWVSARQGQGTSVCAGPPGHVASRKRRVALGSPALRRLSTNEHETWIDFALATAVPDLAWLHPSAAAASLVLRESAYQPEGMLALRERIAARYSRQGLATTPDQILVCAGAQQAISLVAQQYLAPGDSVLMETPNYFGAIDVLRSCGVHLAGIAVQAQARHAPAFTAALAQGRHKLAYVCPALHNPTGLSWSHAGRRALGAHGRPGQLPAAGGRTPWPSCTSKLAPGRCRPQRAHRSFISAACPRRSGPACASAGCGHPRPSSRPCGGPKPMPTSPAARSAPPWPAICSTATTACSRPGAASCRSKLAICTHCCKSICPAGMCARPKAACFYGPGCPHKAAMPPPGSRRPRPCACA